MRPEWRLAISSAFARPSRTLLLVGAVVLSAAMIAAVSCAMASIARAVGVQMDQTVGRAELRIVAAGRSGVIPANALDMARAWPETEKAVGRSQSSIALIFARDAWVKPRQAIGYEFHRVECVGTAVATGIDPELEPLFREIRIVQGRLPTQPGEIAIDEGITEGFGNVKPGSYRVVGEADGGRGSGGEPGAQPADENAAQRANQRGTPKVGDSVEYFRLLRSPIRLTIVGIVARPPIGGRWQVYLTLDGLAKLSGDSATLSEIDIIVKDGVDPKAAAERHRPEVGEKALLQTTERITSGLNQNMKSNELGFILATVMAFLAASFIIMTGLSTGLVEKERELAVLRCIGATKGQLARMQLFVGAIIGGMGGAIGVPLGVLFAYLLSLYFVKELPTGLSVSPFGLAVSCVGAIGSGLIGAAFPAWKATRVSPMEGLSVRSKPLRRRTIPLLIAIGLGLLAIELVIVFSPRDGQVAFWGYATAGLPMMFVGYFLLGGPVLLLVAACFGPLVNKSLSLPPRMLVRTVRATPLRYGFTASAMMSGLAIMVALWTQGRSIMADWLDRFDFPDAFVTGLNLAPVAQERLNAMPFVTGTCAITLQPIETDAFGVKALQKYKSMFIAFEPEPFFKMARLTWEQPTTKEGQERAKRRLQEGGAILVAREFMITQGLGVGDTFRARTDGAAHDFEIVGVVTSPGLEVVSKFFSVGETFTDQSLHAVFGSRADLKSKFNSEAINLIQVGLRKDFDDGEAIARIRTELVDTGVLDAGSGRKIKEEIRVLVSSSLVVASAIAIFAMLIASFGVANIIVAGIHARRFEFGVLRAIGGSRGLLVRLVFGEAVLIAITAIILGTALGIQGIFSGQRLDRLLFGLELTVKPPIGPIALGWLFVAAVTILAAVPAVISLARLRPRELLGAMKG